MSSDLVRDRLSTAVLEEAAFFAVREMDCSGAESDVWESTGSETGAFFLGAFFFGPDFVDFIALNLDRRTAWSSGGITVARVGTTEMLEALESTGA